MADPPDQPGEPEPPLAIDHLAGAVEGVQEAVHQGRRAPARAITRSRRLGLQELPQDARGPLPRPKERFERGCCLLRIHFHASIGDVQRVEAQVLRLRQHIPGEIIGSYSVILIVTG